MQLNTIQRLNQLNQQFYQQIGDSFNATRQRAWPGWDRVWEEISPLWQQESFVVWDLGCGNGRFGKFLAEKSDKQWQYFGSDTDTYLLEQAQTSLSNFPNVQSQFEAQDLVYTFPTNWPQPNVIVLFGVLHHIPSQALREKILLRAASQLAPGGYLAITLWEPQKNEKLWQGKIAPQLIHFSESELEEGDTFLRWENNLDWIRYCHVHTDIEVHNYIQKIPLTVKQEFEADTSNHYLIWQKNS